MDTQSKYLLILVCFAPGFQLAPHSVLLDLMYFVMLYTGVLRCAVQMLDLIWLLTVSCVILDLGFVL